MRKRKLRLENLEVLSENLKVIESFDLDAVGREISYLLHKENGSVMLSVSECAGLEPARLSVSECAIEITPEMIEAGRNALLDSDYRSDNRIRSLDVAENVISAALQARDRAIGAPANEIEITPEMIEAGEDAYCRTDLTHNHPRLSET